MADQSSGGGGSGSAAAAAAMTPILSSSGMREYRKGNWTLQETMILIEAKKMDDERRLKRTSTTATLTDQHQQQQQLTGSSTSTPGSSSSNQQQEIAMLMMMKQATTPTSTSSNKAGGTELRWKWVEDYCWRRGCFRSQNQCNDKWDNLMRDYKKVRDYQRNLTLSNQQQQPEQSYWNMERSERKERGLPSNMLPTIYDALVHVVEKKPLSSLSSPTASPSPASASASALHLPLPPPSAVISTDVQPKSTTSGGALSLLLEQQQQQMSTALSQPPPPSFSSQPLVIPSTSLYQTAPKTIPGDGLLDSDTSSDSPAKRRRKEKRPAEAAAGRAGGDGGPSSATTGDINSSAIANAICKIAEAMHESEKRQDERHREMVVLEQRRLQIEESNVEVNRQVMSGLVDTINTLANSILGLAAAAAAATSNDNNGQTPSPPS